MISNIKRQDLKKLLTKNSGFKKGDLLFFYLKSNDEGMINYCDFILFEAFRKEQALMYLGYDNEITASFRSETYKLGIVEHCFLCDEKIGRLQCTKRPSMENSLKWKHWQPEDITPWFKKV